MQACPIEWITIPAPDLEAAKQFYEHAFGFLVKPYRERFWTFKAGNIAGGFDADLLAGAGGIGFSITVPAMSKAIERIKDHGGTLLKPPYELGPGAGYCARFSDPNGNVLELYCDSAR